MNEIDTAILKNKNIAIIEDNITNMAVFATGLRKYGVRIVQENWNINPKEYLLKHTPIDLVLMDLMLRRGLSGYDVFDELKALPEFENVPIVAISSLDPATEIPKLQARGFAGFISKPINIIRFPEQLATCLAGGDVWLTGR